jgi:acyl-CoA thioester hydrolase
MKNIIEERVRYKDTDHFGVVYYGTYLNWFEAGRTEILRDNNITYADLEKKGFFAPVVEIKVNYKAPARYDDLVIIETTIEKIGNSSIKFNYKIYNKKTKQLLTEAYTINVFINKSMKPVPIPKEIKKLKEK